MTQLLVSVKNVEEALVALDAGVDIIDLKDPANGALGALDLITSAEVVAKVQAYNQFNLTQNPNFAPILTSATVGEHQVTLDDLFNNILQRVDIGVDIIKVAVSSLRAIENWQENFNKRKIIEMKSNIKLVAVFFVDHKIDLALLETFKQLGFYGAMLDTSAKHKNLLEHSSKHDLQTFTQLCKKNILKSGLAGSLKPQHIELLAEMNPFYIGFRGGVCVADARNNTLAIDKVIQVKKLLLKHNKFNDLARQSSSLALHS